MPRIHRHELRLGIAVFAAALLLVGAGAAQAEDDAGKTLLERLKNLQDEDRWQDGTSVFGLPKVANRKVAVGGKQKKVAKTEETEAAAEAKPPEE